MRSLGLIFLLIIFISPNLWGQVKEFSINYTDTTIYKIGELDSVPKFNYHKGNFEKDKFSAFLKDNQKWPTQDDGLFIVYVRFIIETSGTCSNIRVLKGINPDYDSEAIKLIKLMPIWTAGIKNGNYVRTEMSLPIKWSRFND